MSLALTEEHRALADVARAFLRDRDAQGAARAILEAADESKPPFWDELVALGWTGLHLPEAFGGQGYGLAELAIVVEEMGRAGAPGPFLPSAIASAVIATAGTEAQRAKYLPGFAAGTTLGAVAFDASGTALGAALADVILLVDGDDLVIVERTDADMTVEPRRSLDPTRRMAVVHAAGAATTSTDRRIAGGVGVARRIARTLAAAEAAGGARACTDMAAEYAKVRVQFGRPIATFQAVKHRCAEMLVDSEMAAAAAWDAARVADDAASSADLADLAAATAATQALPAFRRCAEGNVQVHGGIGYTWEHDAHLFLRRAAAMNALLGGETDAPEAVTRLRAAGVNAPVALELPPEAEQFRAEARAFKAQYDALPKEQRKAAAIDSGYFVPHWPKPWGRAAGAIEQIVLDEELKGIEKPNMGIGAWVVLTLVQHGSADQVARWARQSLEGELVWCQLFSEPNAGSDAAGITTRGTRVDGGWLINGQKVWTSGAQYCNRGLATVRTDPDAPKHAGVTMVAIDMHAKGVIVRPLREMTGETLFNEVFFDDVFVPDDDVVGPVNQGWTVARATLGNERVSIGGNSSSSLGLSVADDLVTWAGKYRPGDVGVARQVGALVAEARSLVLSNLRQVARAVAGGPPGPEGNVTKLVSAEHAQRVAALGLDIVGAAATMGDEEALSRSYLFARCLTIAGGTSEINRNVIGERILGMPRDPLAR